MKISWELNPDDKDIAGIRISRSNEVDKGFMELTATPLDPKTRTFIDTTFNELFINYYSIHPYFLPYLPKLFIVLIKHKILR